MFFIKKGTVKIMLPLSDGLSYHIVSFTRGGFFGDMAFLDKGKRSANAVAADDVILYILTRKEFDKIAEQNPEIAGRFFEKMALVISHRLRQNNIELKALQEN
jgi:CRP-like cAMP-binding protein